MRERNGERSAACATCGKTFARSDTLLRHEKSHLATEDRGPVHRVTNGTFRACSSCAQARSRCSGGIPCGRCKVRNLECAYPVKRRKMSTAKDDAEFSDTSMVTEGLPNDAPRRSTDARQQPIRFQEIVFSQQTGIDHAGSLQTTRSPPVPAQGTVSTTNTRVRTQPAVSLLDAQYTPDARSGLSETAVRSDVLPDSSYSSQVVPGYGHNFEFPPNSFGFDTGYDESAGLNWIPLSVYPSPYGDLEHDFAFLLPQFSDTASVNLGYNTGDYDQVASNPSINLNADMHIHALTPETRHSSSIRGYARSPASSASEGLGMMRILQHDNNVSEPRKKHKKFHHMQEAFARPPVSRDGFAFPQITTDTSDGEPRGLCDTYQYWSISTAFQRLCATSNYGIPFRSNDFPSHSVLNESIALYFEHFHLTFPLLHAPTIGSDHHWILMLAIAAVGSNYSTRQSCLELRESFAEFLRRAIIASVDDEGGEVKAHGIIQARILNLVNLSQSDRSELRSLAPKAHAELSRWLLESGILQVTDPDPAINLTWTDTQRTKAWHDWIRRESSRRVGYFIWLLDCACGYLCNTRPLCNMDDARAPLPCPESLWNASTIQHWIETKQATPIMPSLCMALEQVYNTKKIISGMSDIAYILLIHALYSRTWEVGTHIKQPLSEWKSTGDARGFLNTPSKEKFWLPENPLYANWRNSACDCLDILHWHATGIVARASGFEHHGVLQLHLARIILLTPFQEIQDLVFFLITHNIGEDSKATYYVHDGSYQRRHPAKLAQTRKITWRWLREDQHKARLAMIHAGSVFWHIKRFSSNSFFEPLAIYLASIVLWTYGSYKSAALEREAVDAGSSKPGAPPDGYNVNVQPSRVEIAAHSRRSKPSSTMYSPAGSSSQGPPSVRPYTAGQDTINSSSDEDEQDHPQFINLDRPCDDEIVQHFVRNGHNMSGYMSNVGDICQTPGKVLIEGAKLLKGKLGCWGISRTYYDILCRINEVRKGNKEGHKVEEQHRSHTKA